MNEKFFELPRDKQDRIVNAALRSFGKNGYRQALTDDIASTAGISKGLLFHYFHNKHELLKYVYEYSIRFIRQRMAESNVASETDFFRLMYVTHLLKIEIMNDYPYMFDFLMNIYLRRDQEAAEISDVHNAGYLSAQREAILKIIDRKKFKDDVSPEHVLNIVLWSAQGFSDMEFHPGDKDFQKLSEKYLVCLEMMRRQFYKQEYL